METTSGRNWDRGKMTPSQVQFARGLLGWSRDRLARSSSVPLQAIADYERVSGAVDELSVSAIRKTLEAAGVQRIAQNGGGPGVRLREIEL